MAWLRFKMNLTAGTKLVGTSLVPGTLDILDSSGKLLATYNKTTSGARDYQKPNDQYVVGAGPLPSCRTASINNYQVALTPDFIPGSVTPGINGNFYHITPDPLKVGSVTRSEFGIHFDANSSVAPGSAGCIVFEDSTQWSNFQKWMSDYKTTYSPGSTTINLIVEYA
jgi:hypothetical protein